MMALARLFKNQPGIHLLAAVLSVLSFTFLFMLVGQRAGEARSAPLRILQGVRAGGVQLGGMTAEQAEQALESLVATVIMQPVVLVHEQDSWLLDPRDIGLRACIRETVTRALAVGRTGSWLTRWRERRIVAEQGRDIPFVLTVDENRFRDYVFELASEIDLPAENAGLVINDDGTVSIRRAITGRRLEAADLGHRIRQVLIQRQDRVVVLGVQAVMPSVSTEQVEAMGIKRCIASYSTKFDPRNEARAHNIRAAAQAINGTLVAPGEVFSFNAAVGPRNEEAGYQEAPVVIEDDLVPGVGGGICQVSSTLYNAVLLANLRIVARANHSVAPAYVPVGRDATVAYDYIDFRFRNDGPGYVMLTSHASAGTAVVKVYGDAPQDREVLISTEIQEKIPPGVIRKEDMSLLPGEEIVDDEGSWGYAVNVYRIVKTGGVETKKELLSRDRYRPRAKRVRVGPGQPRAPDAQGKTTDTRPRL
ncbi:MAG: VanW family protein [Bacillota bacterium]